MKLLVTFALLVTVSLASAFNLRGLGNNTVQLQQKENEPGLYARITNGLVAGPTEFPYQVGVVPLHRGASSICSGSLLSLEWVLTAAHCTHNADTVHLFFGQISLNYNQITIHRPTSHIIEHREFQESTRRNDIALIRIDPTLLPYTIGFVDLPRHLRDITTHIGSTAILAGWGYTSTTATRHSDTLLYARFKVISIADCARVFGYEKINTEKICTETRNRISGCKGDSGGPLMLGRLQIGILSFGYEEGCELGRPNVFTRIEFYLPWIIGHTHIGE